jgi:hypothetical protein
MLNFYFNIKNNTNRKGFIIKAFSYYNFNILYL